MDANVSTMTMPKTMPVQNLLRYISFKTLLGDQPQIHLNGFNLWINPSQYHIINGSTFLELIGLSFSHSLYNLKVRHLDSTQFFLHKSF